MMKNIVLSLFALLSLGSNTTFAQISANADSIRFNPTSEILLDSARLVIYNNCNSEISIQEFKFFNTYSSPAFFVKSLADSSINSNDSLAFYVYFKPRHNVYHNSELLIITNPSAYSITIDLQGQGKYSMPYYATTENKTEDALKSSLKTILTTGQLTLGYNLARDNMFMTIDNQKVNGQGATINTLECIYTGRKAVGFTSRSDAQTNNSFNTEHTYPQSFFSSAEPMVCDLNHLFPTDNNANNSRSNYPFGKATTPYINDATNTPSHLGSNTLYEPRDAQKGKTARGMLYFVLRYQDYSNFFAPQEAILRTWHNDFQPTTVEKKRNADVYTAQKNRNPFIDYPQFIERITKLVASSTTPLVPSVYKLDSVKTIELSDTLDSVIINFPIVNNGNKSVLVYSTNSTNRLVDFHFDSVRVAPGESINLPIVIHTKDTTGTFESGLQFYTDFNLIFLYSRLSFTITHKALGVSATKSNKIQVYPNPVIGDWLLVNGNWTKDTGQKTMDAGLFYNLEGQLILTAPIVDGKINVSELQPGFYTLKTNDGYAKIIKQ
jgi:hypothetical protein